MNVLLLPGQMDEPWEPSKGSALSASGAHWIEKYFHFFTLQSFQDCSQGFKRRPQHI
jgi:hypothetical protein